MRGGRVAERGDGQVLGFEKRLVEARREPGMRLGEAFPHDDEMHDRVEPGLPVIRLLRLAVVGEKPPNCAVAAREAGGRAGGHQRRELAGGEHRREAAPGRQRLDRDFRRQIRLERAVAPGLFQPAGPPDDVRRHHPVFLGQHAADPERGGHRIDRNADLPPLQIGGALDPGIGADIDRRMAEHPRGEDGQADIGNLAARAGEHEGRQRHLGHVELGIGENAVGRLLDRDREIGDFAALDGNAAVDDRAHPVVIARSDRDRKLHPAGQKPTMSPPLRSSLARASSGVAISSDSSSRMRRILATCWPLDSASWPRPR